MRYLIIRLDKNSKSNVGEHFYEQREIWLPVFSNEFEHLLNSGFHITECSVDFDGGYTRVNAFEEIPGWDCAPKENNKYGTLCPNCYLAYEQTMKNFWDAHIKSASQEIQI